MCRDCLLGDRWRHVCGGGVRGVAGRPARLSGKAHGCLVVALWTTVFVLAIPAICLGVIAWSVEGER